MSDNTTSTENSNELSQAVENYKNGTNVYEKVKYSTLDPVYGAINNLNATWDKTVKATDTLLEKSLSPEAYQAVKEQQEKGVKARDFVESVINPTYAAEKGIDKRNEILNNYSSPNLSNSNDESPSLNNGTEIYGKAVENYKNGTNVYEKVKYSTLDPVYGSINNLNATWDKTVKATDTLLEKSLSPEAYQAVKEQQEKGVKARDFVESVVNPTYAAEKGIDKRTEILNNYSSPNLSNSNAKGLYSKSPSLNIEWNLDIDSIKRKRYVLNYAYRNGMAGYWKSMTFDAEDRRQLLRDVYKLIPKGTVDTPTQTTMVRSFDKIIADINDLLTEALNLSKDAAIMEGKSVGYDKINALITDLEAVPQRIYNDFQQKAFFPAEEYCRTQQEEANNVAKKTAENKKWSMLNYKDSYPNVNFDYNISIKEEIID